MGNTFSCLAFLKAHDVKFEENISGTSEQINRPFGTSSTFLLFPGTSCQATVVWSLRDRIHSFIVGFSLN